MPTEKEKETEEVHLQLTEKFGELQGSCDGKPVPQCSMHAAQHAYVLVDSEKGILQALAELSSLDTVAVDTEGVNLGRTGSLTVISFLGVDADAEVAYVVDVQALGGERAFSSDVPSFRSLLEAATTTKITFDCRRDSDALFHQFGVTLRGSLELQVLDQAVRIQSGMAPPTRCPYVVNGGVPYLQSMSAVAQRYLSDTLLKLLSIPAPHILDSKVWGRRPLSPRAVSYAASDVHMIKHMLVAMRKTSLSDLLSERVKLHSQRYEGQFRELEKEEKKKESIMEERPIVDSAELPTSHPRREVSAGQGYKLEKWNAAVQQLRSKEKSQRAFDQVLFILQHDDWYTDEGRRTLQQLANQYPHFTAKQRRKIECPPSLRRDDDYYEDY